MIYRTQGDIRYDTSSTAIQKHIYVTISRVLHNAV